MLLDVGHRYCSYMFDNKFILCCDFLMSIYNIGGGGCNSGRGWVAWGGVGCIHIRLVCVCVCMCGLYFIDFSTLLSSFVFPLNTFFYYIFIIFMEHLQVLLSY